MIDIPIVGALRGGWWAIKKVMATIRGRKPLEVVSVLRSSAEVGNDVMIVNMTDETLHIHHYDIVDAATKGDDKNKFDYVFTLEDQIVNYRLEPKEAKEFFFDEGDHFPMKPSNGQYYFRAWITGREEPVWTSFK